MDHHNALLLADRHAAGPNPPEAVGTRRRPTVVLGDRGSPVLIDYVRSRRALRIRAAGRCAEMGLGELLTRLGVDGTELVPARRYLLFAASGAPLGGVGDLIGVFASEADARRAFVDLRHEVSLRAGWAELSAVDLRGRASVLCSFGRERPLRRRPVPSLTSQESKGDPMSNRIAIQSETSAESTRPSVRRRIRRTVAAGVFGLASIGALALTTTAGDPPNRQPPSSTTVAPLRTPEAVGGRVTASDLPSVPNSDIPGGPVGD